MIIILGLIILLAAVTIGAAGVLGDAGSAEALSPDSRGILVMNSPGYWRDSRRGSCPASRRPGPRRYID